MKVYIISLVLLWVVLTQAKLVMIIRHGEKIDDEHTDLSPRGQARAQCLINVFGNNGVYATPQKIFAQSPSEKKLSTRPRDTVIPLAEALGMEVDLSYTSGKIKKLTNDILSSNDEVTLISWSNDKIPEIAAKFGIINPPEWKGKIFDDIWMIYDSQTTSYLKSSVAKRAVYSGTDGFSMDIVKQNINDCINKKLTDSAYASSDFSSNKTESNNNSDTNNNSLNNNDTSDSSKLTTNLLITFIAFITYIVILL